MSLYLAVDAGGTNTTAALADDSRVLARQSAGTIKLIRTSEEQALANLETLLAQLTEQSRAGLHDVACTCVGLAGIAIPRVADWVRANFAAHVGGNLILVGDEEIALDAAFHGGRGVLVLAGTGSNIVARSSGGIMIHVGGWGPALDDEGSGAWIGSQALRAAFRACDAGERTSLLDRVLAHWHLSHIDDIVAAANRIPGPDLAALTPIVLACAEEGDPVATRVLISAGHELAASALLAIHKLRDLEPDATPPALAMSGGILRHVALVRSAMIDYLHAKIPALRILREPIDPLDGALWRAKNF